MKFKFGKASKGAILGIALAGFGSAAQAVPVDLALSLVIDVSGSVSASEYNLQMDGYANAFRDATVQTNMLSGTNGSTAVNVVFFDDSYYTALNSFEILSSTSDIDTFANTLDTATRPGSGGTVISTGVNRAVDLLLAATASGGALEGTTNLVVDVSGDGTSTTSSTQAARDNAAANGITVNGLPIGGGSITTFYTNSVITSDGFIQEAASFPDFNSAVRNKLRVETGGGQIPEPGTLALFGLGLAGLGFMRKKKA